LKTTKPIVTKFYREGTHHECDFVGGPISPQQIQDGGRRPSLIILWNANLRSGYRSEFFIPSLWYRYLNQIWRKDAAQHTEMTTWSKVETGS